MENVELLLAHAVQLERDAARRFEDLAHSMQSVGNHEVEALFRRLGDFSRMHLKAATSRAGFQTLPALEPAQFQWPEGVTPEAVSWRGVDGALDAVAAIEAALDGERGGVHSYEHVASRSENPEVVKMAGSFASEEAEHVAELERWLERTNRGAAGTQSGTCALSSERSAARSTTREESASNGKSCVSIAGVCWLVTDGRR